MKLPTRPVAPSPEPVELDADHPGFRDPVYRARRNAIAALAAAHRSGRPVPHVDYTGAEQRVWAEVWRDLEPLHRRYCCRPLLRAQRQLGLSRGPIPQMQAVNAVLRATTGFRMEPVVGLIEGAQFLRALADGVFLATQYIRHPSRPHYTPEPDLVHELVGHAASLTRPEIAELSRAFGRAARAAAGDRAAEAALERVYWFTLEFGVVLEDGEPRALGAGLLSSVGELRHMTAGARLLPFDLERMAATPYDPTDLQPFLFAARSYEVLAHRLRDWIARFRG